MLSLPQVLHKTACGGRARGRWRQLRQPCITTYLIASPSPLSSLLTVSPSPTSLPLAHSSHPFTRLWASQRPSDSSWCCHNLRCSYPSPVPPPWTPFFLSFRKVFWYPVSSYRRILHLNTILFLSVPGSPAMLGRRWLVDWFGVHSLYMLPIRNMYHSRGECQYVQWTSVTTINICSDDCETMMIVLSWWFTRSLRKVWVGSAQCRSHLGNGHYFLLSHLWCSRSCATETLSAVYLGQQTLLSAMLSTVLYSTLYTEICNRQYFLQSYLWYSLSCATVQTTHLIPSYWSSSWKKFP